MSQRDEDALNLSMTEESAFADKARDSFRHFVGYTKQDYSLGWHNLLLMKKLQAMADGEIKNLIVSMPPRHGKSELVTRRFPAFIFGKDPNKFIIGASYSMSLAAKMNRDIQKIMSSPRYRAVFPNTRLANTSQREANGVSYLKNTETFEIVGNNGTYKAAGIGTGITGEGMNLGIIDDPIKDRAEAMSQTYRENVWEWFTSTFVTREQKGAQKLITMTRWHEDDLVGRILEHIKHDSDNPAWRDWEVLVLPAIAEGELHPEDPRNEGDALWPSEYNKEFLAGKSGGLGSVWWNSLYQQRPTALEGGIIKKKWLTRRWDDLPSDFEQIIQSWDLPFKNTSKSDYVVGQVWGKKGADRYLLDQVRGRMDFPETIQAFKMMTAKWPQAQIKIIEDKANGPALISSLKKEITGLIPYSPDVSKESRLSAVSMYFEAGNILLPTQSNAPWVQDYIYELTTFPNGVHDDQVDATSQALLRFQNASTGKWTDRMSQKHQTLAGSLGGGTEW